MTFVPIKKETEINLNKPAITKFSNHRRKMRGGQRRQKQLAKLYLNSVKNSPAKEPFTPITLCHSRHNPTL